MQVLKVNNVLLTQSMQWIIQKWHPSPNYRIRDLQNNHLCNPTHWEIDEDETPYPDYVNIKIMINKKDKDKRGCILKRCVNNYGWCEVECFIEIAGEAEIEVGAVGFENKVPDRVIDNRSEKELEEEGVYGKDGGD